MRNFVEEFRVSGTTGWGEEFDRQMREWIDWAAGVMTSEDEDGTIEAQTDE